LHPIMPGSVQQGGAISLSNSLPNRDCRVSCMNCTFTDNYSALMGGAISNQQGDLVVKDSILWNDSATFQGAEIYSFIEDNANVTYTNIEGGWPGTGNINTNPLFADANNYDVHLKSHYGRWDPVQAIWVSDDVNSPCIDAGDPNSDWTEELWPHGGRINMGAYGGTAEASLSSSNVGNLADLNHDGSVDYFDLDLFGDKWTIQESLLSQDMDRNGIVDGKDYATFALNWLWEE